MALTTYEQARPWAKAIKEEVLARRMPKWPVVRGYGDFRNDPSLSPFEVGMIASWVDGGAPRTLPGLKAVEPPHASPLEFQPPESRERTVSCTARTIPAGSLLGVKPMLEKGTSLRLEITHADGSEEPVLWVKDFDPAFAETYWLRNPLAATRETRITISPAAHSCSVGLLYAGS